MADEAANPSAHGEAEQQHELPGMPEYNQYAEIIDFMERKWGYQRPCPYCGTNKWLLGPPIRIAHGAPSDEEASIFYFTQELFTVSCTNCGQTVFINRDAVEEVDELVDATETEDQ